MIQIPSLPISQNTPQRVHFSKWLTFDLLIEVSEMRLLLESLEPLHIFSISCPLPKDQHYIPSSHFLSNYENYIETLKRGNVPLHKEIKEHFYCAVTSSLDALARIPIDNDLELISIEKPLLFIKPICLYISEVDRSIRVGPLSANGILWGIQLSFPQLYQERGSAIIKKSDTNTSFLKKIRAFLRANTRATSFQIASQKVTLPIRLGKECYQWIDTHPQLKSNHIIITSS